MVASNRATVPPIRFSHIELPGWSAAPRGKEIAYRPSRSRKNDLEPRQPSS